MRLMANNRLYIINRRLGVYVYLARFPAFGHFFEPRPDLSLKLKKAFAEDADSQWGDHGWELVDEKTDIRGLREVTS
jgi:hypothetical protein